MINKSKIVNFVSFLTVSSASLLMLSACSFVEPLDEEYWNNFEKNINNTNALITVTEFDKEGQPTVNIDYETDEPVFSTDFIKNIEVIDGYTYELSGFAATLTGYSSFSYANFSSEETKNKVVELSEIANSLYKNIEPLLDGCLISISINYHNSSLEEELSPDYEGYVSLRKLDCDSDFANVIMSTSLDNPGVNFFDLDKKYRNGEIL